MARNFSLETTAVRGNNNNVFPVLVKNKQMKKQANPYQSIILYTVKISLSNTGEIKTFSNKVKLRELFSCRSIPKMAKVF